MIKGCQKRIIYLRSTDSGIFDEAYFVINKECEEGTHSEADMVKEAKRILEGAMLYEEEKKSSKRHALYFCLGSLAATAVFTLLGILFLLL